MIKDGLWQGKRRKSATIYQSRPRPGWANWYSIDGSPHDWLEGREPVEVFRLREKNPIKTLHE